MRIRPRRRPLFSEQPFTGEGASLYVTAGAVVHYRNKAILSARQLCMSAELDYGDQSAKTARVAVVTAPANEFNYTLPADGEFAYDVRVYRDGVETKPIASATISTTAGEEDSAEILGAATLLALEQLAGGVVRIRVAWEPALAGATVTTLAAIRTAGPSSPAEATADAPASRGIVIIDTPALLDASAYTYKIQARGGSATPVDVLTGISITADATGPDVATGGSCEAW